MFILHCCVFSYLQDEHRDTEEKTDELVNSASGGPRRMSGANEVRSIILAV